MFAAEMHTMETDQQLFSAIHLTFTDLLFRRNHNKKKKDLREVR